jgi:hypothetical protein
MRISFTSLAVVALASQSVLGNSWLTGTKAGMQQPSHALGAQLDHYQHHIFVALIVFPIHVHVVPFAVPHLTPPQQFI